MKIYCSVLLVAKVVVAVLIAGLLAGFWLGAADLGVGQPHPSNGASVAIQREHPDRTDPAITEVKEFPARIGVAR